MQVRFLGFSLSTDSTTLSLSDYIVAMIAKHHQAHKLGEHNRFLFLNTTHSNDYYVGLLLTVKDQKTYCELVRDAGTLVVKVNELDRNSNLMDFNFFVIHKITGMGMYQYYHQSCSLSSFGYFNHSRFSECRDCKAAEEISALPENHQTPANQSAIKKKHKGYLKLEILVRKEKLQELIEEFQQIKQFEYCFLTLNAVEPEFQPLKNYVRKERTRLSFRAQSPVRYLAEMIANIVKKNEMTEGKVVGTDVDGNARVLRITDNPDSFGEYAYDTVAPKINSLDVSQFQSSWVVQELLAKCVEHKHLFEIPAR